jgi:hypothetical protein
MLLSYNLLKPRFIVYLPTYSYKNNSILYFYLLYSHDGIAQSITVNDTYTAQNLVNIQTTVLAPLHQHSVSGDTFSGTQKSYGSLIPERAVSFPRRNSLSTWSISKRLDL